MSHTKGEWQTVFFKGISEQEMYVKVIGGDCICKILDRPSVEKKANARLIAAAPNLIAACEKVQDWLDTSSLQQVLVHYTEDERKHALIMGIATNLERLEAAIAKAKKG